MKLKLVKARPLAALIVLVTLVTLGLLPTAAFSERGPLRPPSGNSAQAEDATGARVIVKYKALGSLMRAAAAGAAPASAPLHAAALARRHGLALRDGRVIDGRTQVVRGGTGISSAALAARLDADADVEYAVPDLRRHALALTSDPLLAASASISPAVGQWYLRAPDASFVSAINAVGAWDLSTGSTRIVVADLDTGVLFSHPDLVNKLYPGYDFITDAATAADGGGRDANAEDPGDWTTANECGAGESATTSSWHGTLTSALIGAQTNNGAGMASVGYNVMVLPVRVLGKCGGFDSDIIAGMLWAGGVSSNPVANAHPARVINLSLGGTGACTAAYRDAVSQLTAAGVVVVAAAGNEAGLAVKTPANCAGVIGVAGLRHVGTKVGYSNIGPEVSLSAPAGNCVNTTGACLYPILSATNTGTQGPGGHSYSDSSNYSVGTSFTAPLVAGTAALMLSVNPSLTPAQVRAFLQSSARPFPSTSSDSSVTQCLAPSSVAQDECLCTTSTCGAGMLDAAAAVAAAAVNSLPSVRISASAGSVLVGSTVSFDGSTSTAASGRSIVSYRWAITSGSAIAAFSGATDTSSAQLLTTGSGSVTVQLTVTDSAGVQASSSASVTINPPAAPTVRLLASAQVVTAGSTVSFDGSGSTAAGGLAVAAYQWTISSGAALAAITSAPSGPSVSVATSGSGSGSFTVQLTVTDSLGQQSSASSTVSVTAVTPVASIAASALTVTAGGSVSFDGSGSSASSGRSISSYQWAITSGASIASLSGSASAASTSVLTTGAGSLTVRLTVTDSAGATDSKTSTVTVTAAASGGGGGGGGGAMAEGWLLGLALAVLALARRRRR